MLSPGSLIQGHLATYRMLSSLGKGARGSVWLAIITDVKTATQGLTQSMPVVVKVPPPFGAEHLDSSKRAFLKNVNESLGNEYRLFERLRGVKSAAHVYDCASTPILIGSDPEMCFCLVSEYVQGDSLGKWRQQAVGSLSSAEFFFRWARTLAVAVGEIHRAGVIHGDIHPDNIMIRSSGEAVLIDFGASLIRTAMLEARGTYKSHPYLPPERSRSVAADMYSLCATLYFVATGQEPPQPDHNGKIRAQVVNGLKQYNYALYCECSGIANVIARGLRPLGLAGLDRSADTGQLLADIDLFDPSAAEAAKNLPALVDSIRGVTATLDMHVPIFARIVGNRLRQLEHDIAEMRHDVHDVQGNHEQLVMVMSQYLSVCEQEDTYLTASRPLLWHDGNIGVRGRFLAVNKTVIKRGATVRRVFVLTEDELQDPSTLDILVAHAEMLTEVVDETSAAPFNTTDNDPARGGVFTGIMLLSDEEREQRFAQLPHCGIWIRQGRSAVVLPRYDQHGAHLTGLRLIPGEGPPHVLIDNFARHFLDDEVIELRTFMARRRVGLDSQAKG